MASIDMGSMYQILANAPYAVALLNTQLQYVVASRKWIDDLNLIDDPAGKSHPALFPLMGENWTTLYQLALQGKASKNDAEFTRCLNGDIKWLKWEVQPVFDQYRTVEGILLYQEILTDLEGDNSMLKKKLGLYEATNEAARIGSWEFNFTESELYWSPVTKEIHGTAPDYEPDLQTAFGFFKEGDSRFKIKQYFGAAFSAGTKYEADLQVVTVQGAEIWVRVTGRAEFANGICRRIYGTFQNIQQQKLQEIATANSEIKYRSMIENSQYGIFLTVPGKAVLDANQSAIDMFGYSLQELRQLERAELLFEDDARLCAFTKLKVETGKAIAELSGIRKDGSSFPCQLSATIFKDAAGNQVQSMLAIDITERYLNEEKYRKIFENIQDIYYRTDRHGVLIEISPSVDKYYNYQRDEIIGSSVLEFYYDEEERGRFISALKRKGEVIDFEIKLKSRCSELVYASVNSRLIIENGVVLGAEGSIRDISLRKAQENEMTELNIELKALNTHKEKLLSVIGHDLRSPVAASLKLAELALMDVDEASKEELVEYLSKMEVGLQSANELLENLLQWAKNQFNSLNFNPVLIRDLSQVILTCLKRIRPLAEAKGIELIAHVPPGLKLYADADMIDAIIRNLVSNAIKFSPGGRVTVEVRERDYDMLYSVKDTGIGMSEETVAQLFSRSFSNSTYGTSGEKGTGLGLELCRDFVERHQGKIWVESKIAEGSIFYFSTPI